MPKLSQFSLMILLTFCGLVHGQDASVDPLAKGGVGSSSQQDGNTTGQQEKDAALFPVTVYGPNQKLEIDPADPPHAVTGQGRVSVLRESPNQKVAPPWRRQTSTTIVSGLLQMYSRSGRLMWTIPCRSLGQFTSYGNGRAQGEIAIDSARQRIYLREHGDYEGKIKGRTSAFDFLGNRLWSIAIDGNLMLNPTTGNLWVSEIVGRTLVFDVNGKLIKSLPVDSVAMAYDRKTDSVWTVGGWGLKSHCISTKDFSVLSRNRNGGRGQMSVLIDQEDGSHWVCTSKIHGEIQSPWHTSWIEHMSAEGKLLSRMALGYDEVDRVEPGKPGKLIIHFSNKTEFYDKKTQTFEKFRGRCVASADDSAIWIQDKNGVSAVDFDGKELFSVDIKGPQDWKKEMKMSEKLARDIAAKYSADDPRVLRSQQVVKDWRLFIKGMEFSADEPPFGSARVDVFNLRLIRNLKPTVSGQK